MKRSSTRLFSAEPLGNILVASGARWRITVSRSRRQGDWKAHFNLAWLLERRGRLQEAVQHYQVALKHRPPRADATIALMNLGLALHSLDRPKEATLALTRAWRRNPRDSTTLLNLAMVDSRERRTG